jgi:hypothetical protein
MADDVQVYVVESTPSFSAGILHACKAAKKWLHAVSSQVMVWLAICVTHPKNSTIIEAASV